MVSHSSVNAVQAIHGGVATVSDQTVRVYSLNVMIQTGFTSLATVTWHGVQPTVKSDVTVATDQDQTN
eukprot:728376-Amphidinium_carterae.2